MNGFQHRPLGSSGLHISALGLGTVKLGRNQGVKYPTQFELPSDEQAKALLSLAWELGINFIDTAPAYGISEERLGQLLKGEHARWVVGTKTGEEFDNGKSWFDFSARHTRFSVERSLQRLGRDTLDLVLVHSNGEDVDIIENTDAFTELDKLKQAGVIKAYGMSTKTVEGGILAARESDCVMVTYNLGHASEVAVLDECQRLNKGVLLKKALASGHICHTATQSDPIQASMNYVFAHPSVSSAIVGTINPQHLSDNIAKAKRSLQHD
ncbi:aldo/keto reductase [Gilvimarinus sp. SDUM040013]|uniref:Aldo/keto reductase n=1 Tax=Gilvimarinus gilvus TaxID=3058038 RepID=A0ABU4RX90_9GAMM|nr:aldo/keto reductase [Gilvimarinus sp. SDUM040013]MDO3387873.1 aldo/keto reductase [Gilvimarinus sp. SDUM040013]MDX6848756.1 aldo/keto reductase [Gilvimarinus sp. SDUM040013]